jgi:hypothetical protein
MQVVVKSIFHNVDLMFSVINIKKIFCKLYKTPLVAEDKLKNNIFLLVSMDWICSNKIEELFAKKMMIFVS